MSVNFRSLYDQAVGYLAFAHYLRLCRLRVKLKPQPTPYRVSPVGGEEGVGTKLNIRV